MHITCSSSGLIVLLVGFALRTVPAVVAATGPTWAVYHSWDGGHHYSRRGTLQWTGEEFQLDNHEQLTKEQVTAMMDFGWYHVKIDTMDGEDYIMATVPACSLRRANFKDEFTLLLPRVVASSTSNNNPELHITSLAYTPLVSALAPKSCQDEFYETNALSDSISFTSKVTAHLDTPGMKLRTVLPKIKPPPGYTWLLHPNAKKGSASSAVPGVEPEPEKAQPFFIKYWYVILPLLLANFLPSGSETGPPLPPGAATAPATTGSGETTTASSTSEGGGSAQKASRRTKRGYCTTNTVLP